MSYEGNKQQLKIDVISEFTARRKNNTLGT